MRIKIQFVALLIVLAAACAVAGDVNVSGKWEMQTTSARGITKQTFTVAQKGDSFSGEMITSEGVKEPIKDGKLMGTGIIEFKVERQRAAKFVLVLYTGKINGGGITGTFIGASGNIVNWKATREMLKL